MFDLLKGQSHKRIKYHVSCAAMRLQNISILAVSFGKNVWFIKGLVSQAYRVSFEVCADAAPEHFHFGSDFR